jgi:hypothetical protein
MKFQPTRTAILDASLMLDKTYNARLLYSF